MSGHKKTSYRRVAMLLLLAGVFAMVIKVDAGEQLRVWLDQEKLPTKAPPQVVNAALDAEARIPVAKSLWKEAEKKRFTDLLAQAKPDVVVLPYQIPVGKDELGIDLSARMVMAYMTAQRAALDSTLKVADVELAALATGEARHMTRDEAVAFARSVGAASVIYGHASHDGNGKLAVRIVRASATPGAPDRVASADRIAISDTLTPELAFRKVIDGLMREIGISAVPAARRHAVPDKYFPEDPVSAATSAENPVAGLWTQQLLGSLHAGEGFRGRERVYERTLAGLEFVDPGSPDYRLLAARALVQLGRRPAALEMIGAPKSPEEVAFVEFLNGNAPDLSAAIDRIKRPLPKLLARLDLARVGHAYDFDSTEVMQIAEQSAKSAPHGWQPSIVWNIALTNGWLVRSTMEIKQLLDSQYPVKGFSTEDVVRGKAVAGFSNNPRLAFEIEGTPIEHARKVVEKQGKDWCCAAAAWQPRPFQYLGLLSSLSEAMLLHGLEHQYKVQGNSDQALAMAELLGDTALQGGHPQLQHRTMAILSNLMNRERSLEKRAARANRLYEIARQVRHWETGDPHVVLNAVYYEHEAARVRFAGSGGSSQYPEINQFDADFPPTHLMLRGSRLYKMALNLEADVEIIGRTCSYAVLAMRSCFAWHAALAATGRASDARKLEHDLGVKRFRGNEYLVRHILKAKRASADIADARAFASQAIAASPDRSRVYLDLGMLHLRTGDFDSARKVFLSYPGFAAGAHKNSVTAGGDASRVALAFQNRGNLPEAKRFHEIAVRQETGSHAYFDSLTSLAYMDRRFGDALDTTLRAAQRYPGGGTAYTYSALLFAMGQSNNAWPVAREAMSRYPSSSAWYAIPVAFRIEKTDTKAITTWALDAARLPVAEPRGGDASAYSALVIAIQTLAVDRDIQSIDQLRAIRMEVLPERKLSAFTTQGLTLGERQGSQFDYMDRLVAGYSAHKRNDFEAAWNAFQSYTLPGHTTTSTDAFLTSMPYHAYAAAKTGRGAAFSAYLEPYRKPMLITPLDQPPVYLVEFDMFLSRAVLAAAAGDHGEAKKQLLLARSYNQPITARLLFPAYVYAEICELLAADSGQREYLDLGLSAAKAHQVTEPWSAWAYAFEALHGTHENDRAKAYAIARHLDPQSARLGRVEATIGKKADEWLSFNKPFPDVRTNGRAKTL
jgi:tetratricopeptide (TPR) repeat protein